MAIFQLIRIRQWIKNLFVLMPGFFAGQFMDSEHSLLMVIAFFCFSLTASAVYVLNDLVDVEKDRQHPEKKNRPLASGKVGKGMAIGLIAVLLGAGIGGSFLLPLQFTLVVGGYFFMNVLYSFWLKNVPIIDITIISIGFVLRILAGGIAAGVPVTNWLIVITFLLALVLAIGKRRGEFVAQNGKAQTRAVLAGYNLQFLNTSLIFACTITVVSYIMYTVSEEVIERLGSEYLYMTTIFVVLGILRYLQQAMVFDRIESPTKMIYRDPFIQVVLVGWLVTFGLIIYGSKLGWL